MIKRRDREGNWYTAPRTSYPPDHRPEKYTHRTISEGVHGSVKATKDDRKGIDTEQNGEEGE